MEIRAFPIHLSRFVLLYVSLTVSICIDNARIVCFNLPGKASFAGDKPATIGFAMLWLLPGERLCLSILSRRHPHDFLEHGCEVLTG